MYVSFVLISSDLAAGVDNIREVFFVKTGNCDLIQVISIQLML